MFDLSKEQRSMLCNSVSLKQQESMQTASPQAWHYIKEQYYPSFRRFITNEPSGIDNFRILEGQAALLHSAYDKTLTIGGTVVTVAFRITAIEVFLFRHNPGIVALEIAFDEVTLEKISGLVNAIRNYSSMVTDSATGKDVSMLELIQDHILNKAVGRNVFDLENSKTAEYRGGKLKVFQAIDFKEKPFRPLDKILFELATVSPIGATDDFNDYNAHTPSYFSEIANQALAIYNNWTALCLIDTFTMVGFKYLHSQNTRETWKMNYFRIYVYDLYFKYYLFSFNGDGFLKNKRLKKQRKEFYNFLRVYDADPISYNFLPNLIHSNIKKGLQTHTETEALRMRIDRITSLINEEYSRLSNLILFVISIITLVPSNWNDIYTVKDGSILFTTSNAITMALKILFLIVLWLVNLVVNGTLRRWCFKLLGKQQDL